MLGGAPTPVSWPEVYTSLATGVVEGTKNGITDIVNMKFQEHLRYMTLDGHAYMAALWWMNDDFFNGLTPEQRKIVHDGFQHLKTVTRALPMRRAIDAYEEFKAADGEIYVPTAEEKKQFQDATAGMKELVRSQVRRRVVEEARVGGRRLRGGDRRRVRGVRGLAPGRVEPEGPAGIGGAFPQRGRPGAGRGPAGGRPGQGNPPSGTAGAAERRRGESGAGGDASGAARGC